MLTARGLDPFAAEHERSVVHRADGVELRVLPPDRIIAARRATNRPKDLAQLPALEAALPAKRERG